MKYREYKLKEIAEIIMGVSPQNDKIGKEGMEFHQGKIHFSDKIIKKSEINTLHITKKSVKDDILLCVRAPVGIVNINDREICIGRGLSAIRSKKINKNFLFYKIKNSLEYFKKNSTGSTFEAINKKVKRICISRFLVKQNKKK